ncbi:MAG TPA: phosphate acyltransferase PlsX [Synergistales bacterium]|nr:phosphate acyltransferase PlsX [Synergistaceae bacterium]HPA58912.1 phosphate acyltransferase PlsX [Synergistales bacterium]HQO82705.1 phosphate acyltransferase PlsX [Synergistales bacterium]HQQ09808.1 phosphate acyltransferase PlsX [Synergistales bacterium]
MLLALDVMGGDNAPLETCAGAVMACERFADLELALVGDTEAVRPLLEKAPASVRTRLHLVHAEEVITMDEPPAVAVRKKRHSSLRIAMQMVRSGEAQGCVSAGSTGAIVAGGVLVVGRISGIERPGLGVPLPAVDRISMLIDIGATVRCKPLNLYQFALMGDVYMRKIIGVESPSIGLLSNGQEEVKGDELIIEAREFFRKSRLNFIGNVEGGAIPFGAADVVVCEGFTGNILLKFIEGTGEAMYSLVREEISRRFLAKVGMLFMIPMLKDLWARFNYEETGGTPLLGVNGAVIKAHGRSRARAICGAVGVAREFVMKRGVETIAQELAEGVIRE